MSDMHLSFQQRSYRTNNGHIESTDKAMCRGSLAPKKSDFFIEGSLGQTSYRGKAYQLHRRNYTAERRTEQVKTYLKGTPLTPWDQMALLSLVSILTSVVPICFSANFLIS